MLVEFVLRRVKQLAVDSGAASGNSDAGIRQEIDDFLILTEKLFRLLKMTHKGGLVC